MVGLALRGAKPTIGELISEHFLKSTSEFNLLVLLLNDFFYGNNYV